MSSTPEVGTRVELETWCCGNCMKTVVTEVKTVTFYNRWSQPPPGWLFARLTGRPYHAAAVCSVECAEALSSTVG